MIRLDVFRCFAVYKYFGAMYTDGDYFFCYSNNADVNIPKWLENARFLPENRCWAMSVELLY